MLPSLGQNAEGGWRLRHVKGDLFSCREDEVLAHCISEDCRMGAGIAVKFKKQFSGVDELKKQSESCVFMFVIMHSTCYGSLLWCAIFTSKFALQIEGIVYIISQCHWSRSLSTVFFFREGARAMCCTEKKQAFCVLPGKMLIPTNWNI